MIGEVEIGSSTELDPNFWKKTCLKMHLDWECKETCAEILEAPKRANEVTCSRR